MGIDIRTLIETFETWANPAWQESWDNCGWQIQPDILEQDAHVLVCLTPTLAVMEEAISLQHSGIPINLIFAHHPLIFGGIQSIVVGSPIGEMVRHAFHSGIGVYSAHTNFDQVQDGTADLLAQLLNLSEVSPLQPTQNGLGYGRLGTLSPALLLPALLDLIQAKLNPPRLIYSPEADMSQKIHRIAVLGGSGASYISAVAQTDAQAYLTADCKFHQFQESRDRNLILIDAGHYATERPACARLVEKLQAMGVAHGQLSRKDEDFRQFWA